MKFTEKLRQLTDRRNKAELARSVGLKDTAISDYIREGYSPRGDIALKMARALDVPVEWLLDDTLGMPAPKTLKPSPAMLSDGELMREVATRFRRDVVRTVEAIERREKIDWREVAERMLAIPSGGPLPEDLMPAAVLSQTGPEDVPDAGWEFAYSIPKYAQAHHAELPGADRKPEELEPRAVAERGRRVIVNNPFFRIVADYVATAKRAEPDAAGRAAVAAKREELLARLASATGQINPKKPGKK